MPPAKRLTKVFKLGLGQLEDMLLQRLQRDVGGSASDHARAAIVEYALAHPGLNEEALHLAGAGRAISGGEDGKRLAREIEQFLDQRRSRRTPTKRRDQVDEPTLTGDLAPARHPVDPIDDDSE